MINQPEPLYNVFHVVPDGYKGIIQKHRNILVLNIGKQYTKADMHAAYDLAAKPQLILTVEAPSVQEMAGFIEEYKYELVKIFDIAERDRSMIRANQFRDKKIVEKIKDKFGFTMSIPEGYSIRNEKDNFMWISMEFPLSSIGFAIYTYPADTVNLENNQKAGNILNARNIAVKEIPGPSEGSFMSTATAVWPDQKILTVRGREWNQIRGFWDVVGDFMGGPFINYTTYDEVNHRMLAIDCYVYNPSPNNRVGKRNYIRQLEAIFMTANVPSK